MRDEEDADAQTLARFLAEARISGRLQHPGIVPVHELGVDADGAVYYTMTLIQGQSLAAILDRLREGNDAVRAAYPLPRLLSIFARGCDAMAYAHARRVIHRDLKPENVMVGEYGQVLVVDWGIAKALDTDEDVTVPAGSASSPIERDGVQTLAGQVMGTPACMSPEQALGATAAVDERTDVFALGAILAHLLTLQPPAAASTSVSPDFPRHIPEPLRAIVRKAMAHEPADRYPTAATSSSASRTRSPRNP